MKKRIGALLGVLVIGLVVVSVPAQSATKRSGQFTLNGRSCQLIGTNVGNATPVGVTACPGVRPGGFVQSEKGSCSLNFVFDGTDGRRYIGTAGHCISEEGKERVWTPGTGPQALGADGSRIGEFAYAILKDPRDIALIRLDPRVASSPQMCHFGGPTGINTDETGSPVLLQHYGNGVLAGDILPARTALALGLPDPDVAYAVGLVTPGDSGSGIISSDGRAVGVVVTLGVTLGTILGDVGITRLGPQIAQASGAMGVGLKLATADLL